MPHRFFLLITAVSAVLGSLFFFERHRRIRREKIRAADERHLWIGLAASLFDSAESPASKRMELALSAIARRLKMRAGMVTLHGAHTCRLMAGTESGFSLLADLQQFSRIPRHSIYCGSLSDRGQLLAIDYVSLSEWRRHGAFTERGWESYLGVNCGKQGEEDIIVSFFDTVPRDQLFDRSEKALVEQLAPWVAAMVAEEFPEAAESTEIPVARSRDSSIL